MVMGVVRQVRSRLADHMTGLCAVVHSVGQNLRRMDSAHSAPCPKRSGHPYTNTEGSIFKTKLGLYVWANIEQESGRYILNYLSVVLSDV